MKDVVLKDGRIESRVSASRSRQLWDLEKKEHGVSPGDVNLVSNALRLHARETREILDKAKSELDPRTFDTLSVDAARAEKIAEFLEEGEFVLIRKRPERR